ncbi:polyprenyl synthetase family protein [Methanimicrococcus blatticola]|uniref:Farnesyl-diphosphate synthase /geranylgeranyl-diphosphate synthase n=1 Tax=Methanimicrococcus blatticola TaxID=91560 RepID=A0A484F740_9EURY|nr:polyprenyl synthetase family protein [Methanimicrococcus blatticola]MBZ3935103.1 polyprenyl synthetase family protein [Methanimicrococcus blatticola]MCC2508800.1 polyprenyl synthetase family protein [Methanimicrococcus blatticola]TDQ71168.1 farnesyl-diphosphate synthase /geranylgeranyl-diphosphate synthase [Methanimicrococcus blatticola]
MTVVDEIKKLSVPVDEAIETMLPVKKPEGLYEASRHIVKAGGKRLRPAVLLASAEAVGGDIKTAVPAAVAVELMHTFTLVHDDIMDNDPVRRGLPAVHTVWGEAGGILAGDTLYSKAIEIITEADSEPARLLKASNILSKTCVEVCEGQWLDIDFENRDSVSAEEYLEMIEKKTAILFGAAAQIGAIIGGADSKVDQAMYDFGRLTGLGFQIYDDVLDLTTPEEVLGKRQGSDIFEGKRTLLMIHATEKGAIPRAFGKGSGTKEDIEEAIQVLTDSGSLAYVKDLAVGFVEEGKAKLDVLPDSPAKQLLKDMADYMLYRDY